MTPTLPPLPTDRPGDAGQHSVDLLLSNLRGTTLGFTNFGKRNCELAVAEIERLRARERADALVAEKALIELRKSQEST